MTKRYYDDALQAAWMAREFGVRITTENGLDVANVAVGMASRLNDSFVYHDPPYHIHPDSLRLFEPIEGDLVTSWSFPDGIRSKSGIQKSLISKGREVKIIQRNGKAFFMPEEEL